MYISLYWYIHHFSVMMDDKSILRGVGDGDVVGDRKMTTKHHSLYSFSYIFLQLRITTFLNVT